MLANGEFTFLKKKAMKIKDLKEKASLSELLIIEEVEKTITEDIQNKCKKEIILLVERIIVNNNITIQNSEFKLINFVRDLKKAIDEYGD